MVKFVKRKSFYRFPVYEFNLPAGHSCPYAQDCKIKVDRKSGKFETTGTKFRCYAALSERFPAVRKSRWENFEAVLKGEPIVLPKGARHVRIHGSGDFYSQEYFDRWLIVCTNNPTVRFWAFTKSVRFWVNRLSKIPANLTLQASRGGQDDHLIEEFDLKFAQVFTSLKDFRASGLPLDTDDSLAMCGQKSFALLDNNRFPKSMPAETWSSTQ